jgi:hypothetical protein
MRVEVAGNFSARREEFRKMMTEIEERWKFYSDCGIHEDTGDGDIIMADIRWLLDTISALMEDNEILDNANSRHIMERQRRP